MNPKLNHNDSRPPPDDMETSNEGRSNKNNHLFINKKNKIMPTNNQLNTAWLVQLPNAHHDGTTQQIDDHVGYFFFFGLGSSKARQVSRTRAER